MNRRSILIVEDDANLRETLRVEFMDRGFLVTCIDSFAQFSQFHGIDFDYALIDLRVGGENGLRFLQSFLKSNSNCKSVVLTGYGSIATAVLAMKLGACDYLTKPASIDDILASFEQNHDRSGQSNGFIQVDNIPSLARKEREYIEAVLAECDGNITKAARKLGLYRQSLQRKLRKYPPKE
jgi:two-component system response regulator RegA